MINMKNPKFWFILIIGSTLIGCMIAMLICFAPYAFMQATGVEFEPLNSVFMSIWLIASLATASKVIGECAPTN